MGFLLSVPAMLNVTVGSSLSVWWAPFPLWIFALSALSVPPIASAFIPTAVFIALSLALLAGWRGSAMTVVCLVGGSLVTHAAWMIYLFGEGIRRHGLAYTGTVFGIGTIVLMLSSWQCASGRRRRDERRLVLSAWLALLWWSWWATPWLGEGI